MILSPEQGYIRIAIRRQNSQKKDQRQMNSRSLTDFINIEKSFLTIKGLLASFRSTLLLPEWG